MEPLKFIHDVKDHFSNCNQSERYDQFASALKDFRRRKINGSALVSTVKILLQGHDNLLQEFMIFLPPDLQEIAASEGNPDEETPQLQIQEVALSGEGDDTREQASHLQDGIAFINKVRSRFGNSNHLGVYRSFLKTMCKYGKKKKSVAEVYDKMFDIFHGHADLVQEFEGFLNDNTEKVLKEIKRTRAFSMEDRMYEVDVLLSNMTSAIMRAEGILKGRRKCVKEGLTPLQLRCFERLYAERGPEVTEQLRANPKVVLPMILPRLKKKKEELTRARQISHQFWAELHQLRKQNKKLQSN